ncbi:MAG: MFS transporter [Nitrososphaerota archaeon]|nr:MFS transporter [Nitrososphaerota archaeon]MDG7023570.1 MFS transporter [Nitrososphaerota archaeon]
MTQFTGQISDLALPTVAILLLQVTAFQLGVLNALAFIAFPILGLPAGVWIDRVRRRPVLVAMSLIQVAALASVPSAFVLGLLSLYQLYLVALVMGTTTLFFDVAYQSYLPSLVRKEDVVKGNQKLQVSASGAQVIGPSVASGLMVALGAAKAVVSDAVGTLAASILLISMRKPEPIPEGSPGGGERHFLAEMKEGIRVITSNKLLWTQAGCTSTSNLGTNIFGVAIFLYAYRILGISQGSIGIAFSMGAAGFLVGALISRRVTARAGLGRAIALSVAANFALLIVLLAGGGYAVLVLGLAFFLSYMGTPIYNINQVSLRQIITPNRLQGRMNATMRTIVWGSIPVGALLGGVLASVFGVMPTLAIGILIAGSSVLWIVLGPTFRLKKQPDPVE